MTAPMIGNYGINPEDVESDRPRVAGVVVRELANLIDMLDQGEDSFAAKRAVERLLEPIQIRQGHCDVALLLKKSRKQIQIARVAVDQQDCRRNAHHDMP